MNAVDPDTGARRGNKVARGLLIGLAGGGAFVVMMYNMSQMNDHMGRMVDSVVQMAGDVGAMRDDMDAMCCFQQHFILTNWHYRPKADIRRT
jgi:hypothetical protein